MKALVLASASPRRKQLLTQLLFSEPDVSFSVLPTDIDETPKPEEAPDALVLRLACEKAHAAWLLARSESRFPEASYVHFLGSDTLVVLNNVALGKPIDEDDAKKMLQALSNHEHEVFTAIAITDGIKTITRLVKTRVNFCALSTWDIESYIATGEPMDKAGAYGIQGMGGNFVSSIDGSYSAVVGLPLVETRDLLKEIQLMR
ncbi:nucleoside triphosphate pyrophosphatase [uncultured Shewanella sp.]|uniref:Maf family protein n=1 Tax=uncultured Shewanella sp. TaxID=173975 RepID=UPI00261E2A1F|nr:Maf family protein [uncultured Shewanella sp.]